MYVTEEDGFQTVFGYNVPEQMSMEEALEYVKAGMGELVDRKD